MGLFDNFIKAVESGALEDRLNKVADTVEKASQKAEQTLGSAAEKPAETLTSVESKAKDAVDRVGKSIDAVRKKD